jgi:hypothetical protein
VRVWLAALSTLGYPVDGYFWISLNWALGLRSLGCELVWFEEHDPDWSDDELAEKTSYVQGLLATHLPEASFALDTEVPAGVAEKLSFTPLTLEDIAASDVLISFAKRLRDRVVRRFGCAALLDVDPGITQGWIKYGAYKLADYDVYFTVGEGVPPNDAGYHWEHTFPCVALDHWPVSAPAPDAAFTTVTHWGPGRTFSDGKEIYPNDKRRSFLPYLALPQRTAQPLELAIPIGHQDWPPWPEEYAKLRADGWRLRDATQLASPWDYQRYVQGSLGEFSCAKPAYVDLKIGWMSDRTVCYLASGKPAIVQYTGPSKVLPDAGGLFRFRSPDEAVSCLEAAMKEYDENCRLARALAEEHFDARKVVARVLERTVEARQAPAHTR